MRDEKVPEIDDFVMQSSPPNPANSHLCAVLSCPISHQVLWDGVFISFFIFSP
jgi:hypothetical protein